MLIAVLIPLAIVIIPAAGTTIFEILANISSYERPYKVLNGYSHIVVCGNLEITQLRRFLKEWYHRDLGTSRRKVCYGCVLRYKGRI